MLLFTSVDIDQFKAGGGKAFDSVYRYYSRPLQHFAFSYVKDRGLAEEVLSVRAGRVLPIRDLIERDKNHPSVFRQSKWHARSVGPKLSTKRKLQIALPDNATGLACQVMDKAVIVTTGDLEINFNAQLGKIEGR